MRKEFQKYLFRDIDIIVADKTKNYKFDNYVLQVSSNPNKYIRYIDGKPINIIGNIYLSKKYKNEIEQINFNIIRRWLKEKHLEITDEFKKGLLEGDFYGLAVEMVKQSYLDAFLNFYSLYIFKLS